MLDATRYEFVGFGMGVPKNNGFLAEYLNNPSHEELRTLYKSCQIWFCPSVLEGFCNIGAEAAVCGCLLVCVDRRESGTQDYATEETAHLFSTLEEAAKHIRNPDWSKVLKCQKLLKEKVGTREQAMKKFVEVL